MNVEKVFLRVVRVQTMYAGEILTNASGFFFLENNLLYVITCRHVVFDEPTGHRPDALSLTIHCDAADLGETSQLTVPLYKDEEPRWRIHPEQGQTVDVAAVPIDDPNVMGRHLVDAFTPDDLLGKDADLSAGQDVLVVGYPLGFHDTVNYLPIARHATIASSFKHPFKGDRYFLTDARTHRGTSGSPVVANLAAASEKGAGGGEPVWKLLGVHSASLDVSDRDPQQDDRLDLNSAWYATEIPAIVRARQPQTVLQA